jgi:hypothetical protein
MRTLVFGDVHHKVDRVDHLLKTVPHDEAICLGDWMDDFNDGSAAATKTASYMKWFLAQPNHVSLMGNHDLPYFWPTVKAFRYWGWSRRKMDVFTDILKPVSNYRRHTKYYVVSQGILLSHAGLNAKLLPAMGVSTPEEILYWLWQTVDTAIVMLYATNGMYDATASVAQILDAGEDRGGINKHGGILWSDFSSLTPIEGLPQLVGHTQGKDVRTNGNIICIDTNLRHYAIIEDGVLTTHEADYE